MRIIHAKIFYQGVFIDGAIEFDQHITHIGSDIDHDGIDMNGAYIIPGLIDIHSHGAMGADASDGSSDGLLALSHYYASSGITSWCPTTMTLPESDLTHAMHSIRDFQRPHDGAKLVGVNLEGPFLCYNRRGAQAATHLHTPDISMFHRLNDACGGQIRLTTVAPEVPLAMAFIREISQICHVSLGHTDADYDTAVAAFTAGASHVTHLFNAMPQLMHRMPGVIGAAYDMGATAELITDGLHIHPAMVRLSHHLFGHRLTLISDSLRCAGMPDGDYTLGGQPITLKNHMATLQGTDTLAGSAIHLLEGLRRAVSFGIPLEDAILSSTLTPAQVIGMEQEIGSLSVGKWADMLIIDKDLNLKQVFINGTSVYNINNLSY